MDTLIVLLILAVAGFWLGRRTWRRWRGNGSCKSHCGCGKRPESRTR